MSIKIEEFEQYNIKGYTIDSIIEMAYRFGRQNAQYGGGDNLAKDMEMIKDTLVGFDSFKEINEQHGK
jgi:hypothetical protein|tara:strand:+ start:774 stop:977 length:204 start_codon:yes stop_codon:yes gene_type:complete